MPTVDELKNKIKGKKYALDEAFSTAEQETVVRTAIQPTTQQNVQQNTIPASIDFPKVGVSQPSKPAYPEKMTFYMTPEHYKAFNDIYATRLLRGRRTEKSALICEAIELLLAKERLDGNI